nr:hypothetical protein [Candidatus Baldrarchaeota archaeon]
MQPNHPRYGEVIKRVLVIFVNNYPKVLKQFEISKWSDLKYSSVKPAIHCLYELGLLVRKGRGHTFYIAKSKP